jgi:bleomycin hydrolase
MSINIKHYKSVLNEYNNNPMNNITSNICQNINIDQHINNNVLDKLDHVFSNIIDGESDVLDQKRTGTCWIFAGISMFRRILIKNMKLSSDFNLSLNYLVFWDKMEKANYFMNYIINNSLDNIDSYNMKEFLSDPISDGGYWESFVHLVLKYGLIPESINKLRYSSVNSHSLNNLIKYKLREFASLIMSPNNDENIKYPKTPKEMEILKNEYLDNIFILLTTFMGTPVFPDDTFDWHYMNNKNKKCIEFSITPIHFYRDYIDVDLTDYIIIINDPRPKHPYYKGYQKKEEYHNMERPKMLNLPMNYIKDLIRKQLDDDTPVWFACEVDYYISHKYNFMSMELCNYDITCSNSSNFNMSKADRLDFMDSGASHAMVIVGYDVHDRITSTKKEKKSNKKRVKLNESNNIAKFMVENSWGKYGNNNGYYAMYDSWTDMFCYMFIIDKKHIDKIYLDALDQECEFLNINDPFGKM